MQRVGSHRNVSCTFEVPTPDCWTGGGLPINAGTSVLTALVTSQASRPGGGSQVAWNSATSRLTAGTLFGFWNGYTEPWFLANSLTLQHLPDLVRQLGTPPLLWAGKGLGNTRGRVQKEEKFSFLSKTNQVKKKKRQSQNLMQCYHWFLKTNPENQDTLTEKKVLRDNPTHQS